MTLSKVPPSVFPGLRFWESTQNALAQEAANLDSKGEKCPLVVLRREVRAAKNRGHEIKVPYFFQGEALKSLLLHLPTLT